VQTVSPAAGGEPYAIDAQHAEAAIQHAA